MENTAIDNLEIDIKSYADEIVKELTGISNATTSALVEELKQREAVKTHIVEPYADLEIKVNGPAVVLVITD